MWLTEYEGDCVVCGQDYEGDHVVCGQDYEGDDVVYGQESVPFVKEVKTQYFALGMLYLKPMDEDTCN